MYHIFKKIKEKLFLILRPQNRHLFFSDVLYTFLTENILNEVYAIFLSKMIIE